jgi:hypothetical protein
MNRVNCSKPGYTKIPYNLIFTEQKLNISMTNIYITVLLPKIFKLFLFARTW